MPKKIRHWIGLVRKKCPVSSTAMRLGTRRIDTAGFEVQIEGEQVSR